MAVPSSGQLRLRGDIALEVDGSATGSNVSLRSLSASAGFSTPDNMSEFYGYSSAVAPSVITYNSSSVTETSMTISGNVTSDGGASITQRGFYFGTNSSSPTNNTKYTIGGSTGSYSLNRTSLSPGTTYYSWAFATNSQGTTYGSRVSQATIQQFNPVYVSHSSYYYSPGFYSVWSKTFTGQLGYINPYTGAYVTYFTGQAPNYSYHLDTDDQSYVGNALNFNLTTAPTGQQFADYTASGNPSSNYRYPDASYTPVRIGNSNFTSFNYTFYPSTSTRLRLDGRVNMNTNQACEAGYIWRWNN